MTGRGALLAVAEREASPGAAEAQAAPPVPAQPSRRARPRDVLMRAAAVLVVVGLVTMSWDRLLNVQVAGYNVKLPALAFSLSCVLALVASRDRRSALAGDRRRRVVLGLAGAIVVYEAVRGAFSAAPVSAVAQVAALLSGAVLPAVALLLVVRTRADLLKALRWVLVGAAAASAFGLYQLTAFYAGWPQGITYTGVGIGTGIGRISSFNYEPAYFAYYVVLALGAYLALRRSTGRDPQWAALAGFAAILYLANVRAVPLVVLAFGVVILIALPWYRRLLVRGGAVAVATLVVALAVPLVLAQIAAVQAQALADAAATAQQSTDDGPDGVDAPSPVPSASSSDEAVDAAAKAAKEKRAAEKSASVASSAHEVVQSQLQSVNPGEQSSNAPRLGLYRAVMAQIATSPVFGIGPGNLGPALRAASPEAIADQQQGQVVANNIWLQALADGGVPLLLLEAALIGSVLVMALRRRGSAAYPMAAAWLAVVGVGGMLTSYLFDLKVWVVLALLLVALATSADRAASTAARSVRS